MYVYVSIRISIYIYMIFDGLALWRRHRQLQGGQRPPLHRHARLCPHSTPAPFEKAVFAILKSRSQHASVILASRFQQKSFQHVSAILKSRFGHASAIFQTPISLAILTSRFRGAGIDSYEAGNALRYIAMRRANAAHIRLSAAHIRQSPAYIRQSLTYKTVTSIYKTVN